MITERQHLKIDHLVSILNKLESSDSSTATPFEICNDLASQKFDVSLSYLDPCCGKGSILLALYLKFWDALDIEDIEEKNKYIMGRLGGSDICKAQLAMAKETLRKIQKIMGIKNTLEAFFDNIDILDENCPKAKGLKRKFDVVITNPPYNGVRDNGENNSSWDIYPKFVEKAFELADRYVIMITKSSWMSAANHGDFREKMINEFNVNKIVHYTENPFDGTTISGGVSYFVIDNQSTKTTFELNGVVYNRKAALDFLPYTLNKDELTVLNKVLAFSKMDMSNFRGRGYYKIASNDQRLSEKKVKNSVKCHVSQQKGEIKYFPKSEFNNKIIKDLRQPKIFTSAAYGCNPFSIGRIVKSDTNEVCCDGILGWVFDSVENRDGFYSFMNTKFFRFCVSLKKYSHNTTRLSFGAIPDIDLSLLEKVDDANIYKHLNLTEEDIKIIEERCDRLNLMKTVKEEETECTSV